VDPVPDSLVLRKYGSVGDLIWTSGSVARNAMFCVTCLVSKYMQEVTLAFNMRVSCRIRKGNLLVSKPVSKNVSFLARYFTSSTIINISTTNYI
jgi:hypothetical protein